MATKYTDGWPEPKYWDEENQCVYTSTKSCSEDISLASLAGTYRWVQISHIDWGCTEYRYENDPEVLKSEYPGYPGYFKISFPEDDKPSLKNMSGTFRIWDMMGSFTGVSPYKTRFAKVPKILPNFWDIDRVEWDPDSCEDEESEDWHTLLASDLLDDNGNRFITFYWVERFSGCGPEGAHWLGKKQSDEDALVGLTEAERERLALYLTDEEVKSRALAKAPKKEEEVAAVPAVSKRKITEEDVKRDVKRKRED